MSTSVQDRETTILICKNRSDPRNLYDHLVNSSREFDRKSRVGRRRGSVALGIGLRPNFVGLYYRRASGRRLIVLWLSTSLLRLLVLLNLNGRGRHLPILLTDIARLRIGVTSASAFFVGKNGHAE